MPDSELSRQIERDGFAFVRDFADSETINRLQAAVTDIADSPHARTRQGSTFGLRNLLQVVPEAHEWAWSPNVLKQIRSILGPLAQPVKGILFDKTEHANWAVPWHQDVTIAVQRRCELPGYELWSEKGGIPNVQPPTEMLQQILAVRLHLDPCPANNGALRVLPGSHAAGRLSDQQIEDWKSKCPEVACEAKTGDALLIRPLLLHASGSARSPSHRRVLHVEYTAALLPEGLDWAG
jgi:ectoine hydroxylase-related dioxygenase (phytanoyl-CoA dioxygenase family)